MDGESQGLLRSESADLVPTQEPASREALAVAARLESKAGLSGSHNTARAYRATIASWQAALQAVRLTLAPPAEAGARETWLAATATVAQRWAGAGEVAPATYNRRCAIISSFYAFAARRGLFPAANPLSRVDRRRVQGYANAVAPGDRELREVLAALAAGDMCARRDRAIIAVAIETTRRLSEVASLRWGHLRRNADATITLTFARTKGGRVRRDRLSRALSADLLAYLRLAYGPSLEQVGADAAIWVSVSRQNAGAALSARSLESIARARLGYTSTRCATRERASWSGRARG